MRKRVFALFATLLFAVISCVAVACSKDPENYGEVKIDDITVTVGESITLDPEFSMEEFKSHVTYSYTGDSIVIDGNVVTAVKPGEVKVTASTQFHSGIEFTVTVVERTDDNGDNQNPDNGDNQNPDGGDNQNPGGDQNPDDNDADHEHTYATVWSSDATNHWHAATCAHTDEKSDVTAHTFGDDNECDVCGYERASHEHTYEDEWSSDATHHWHAASCEHNLEKSDYAEHDFDGDVCSVCEYEREHQHSFEAEWSHDDNIHWHAATCEHTDVKGTEQLHEFGSTNVCSVCRYERPITPPDLPDYGTLTIADVEMALGVDQPKLIIPTFSKPETACKITYSFDSNAISIDDNDNDDPTDDTVTALAAGVVTVNVHTSCHGASFTVRVVDHGTMSIDDINIELNGGKSIIPVFSVGTARVTYTIKNAADENNISIQGGYVTGLIAGTDTTVVATTPYHRTEFNVHVYDRGTLSFAANVLNVDLNVPTLINPIFSSEEGVAKITYVYSGTNITIDDKGNDDPTDDTVTGNVIGTTTDVRATTAYHTAGTLVKIHVNNRGTLTITDKTLNEDATLAINPQFSVGTDGVTAEDIVYSGYDTNKISIVGGVITGLSAGTTTVTATTDFHSVTFDVTVNAIDRGTLSINDITVEVGSTAGIAVVFSKPEYASKISYEFEGNKIEIDAEDDNHTNDVISALALGTTTVTATTARHSTTFDVTVTAVDYGTLTIEDKNIRVSGAAQNVGAVFSKSQHAGKITYLYTAGYFTIDDQGDNDYTNDTVEPVAVGTATVTATTANHTETFTVTIYAEDVGTLTFKLPAPRFEEEREAKYVVQDDGSTNILYTNYSPRPLTATFSKSEWATDVTYTTNNSRVKVNAQGIYAEGSFATPEEVTITATTAYGHSASRKIWVCNFEGAGGGLSDPQRSLSIESSVINDRLTRWQNRGGDKGGVVFIGDSFMDRGFWSNFDETFKNMNVQTMGISSSTTTDWEIISERLLYPLEPKAVVIHCGTNNIWDDDHKTGQHKDATTTYNDVVRLLEQIHTNLPTATIYYYGIEPRTYGTSNNATATAVNTSLKSYMNSRSWVTYIDSPSFVYASGVDGSGSIDTTFYRVTGKDENGNDVHDGCHPRVEKYALYINALTSLGVTFEVTASAYNNTTVADLNIPTALGGGKIGYHDVTYRGLPIKNDYVLSGTLNITSANIGSNPHAHFVFNTSANRLLIWDNNGNGKFGAAWGLSDNYTNEAGYENYTYSAGCNIYFRLIVKGTTAYFYLGSEAGQYNLEAIWQNVPIVSSLKIGAEQMACSFKNMTVKTLADDATEYNNIVNAAGIACSVRSTSGSDVTRAFNGNIYGKGLNDTVNYDENAPKSHLFYYNDNSALNGDFKINYTMELLSHHDDGNWFAVATLSTDATMHMWDIDYHMLYWNGQIKSHGSKGTSPAAVTPATNKIDVEVQRTGSNTYIKMRENGTSTWSTKECTDIGTGTLYFFINAEDCDIRITNLTFA